MKKFLGTAALAATALSLAAAISLAQAGLTAVASPDVKQSDFSQLDGVAVAGAGSAWRPALPGTRNRIAAPRSGRCSSAEADRLVDSARGVPAERRRHQAACGDGDFPRQRMGGDFLNAVAGVAGQPLRAAGDRNGSNPITATADRDHRRLTVRAAG